MYVEIEYTTNLPTTATNNRVSVSQQLQNVRSRKLLLQNFYRFPINTVPIVKEGDPIKSHPMVIFRVLFKTLAVDDRVTRN